MKKDKKVYLTQRQPYIADYTFLTPDERELHFDNLKSALKYFYFQNKNENLIIQIKNQSSKCRKCKSLQCRKHLTKYLINRNDINLDEPMTTMEDLINQLRKDKKIVKDDSWFYTTYLWFAAVAALVILVVYLLIFYHII